MQFSKYQGTGNDFILIDNRSNIFPKSNAKLIQKLTDRKFGIGADGLILIENHPDQDFRMVYFNSDGSQSLCGNGSRCAISFAQELGIISDQTVFETTDGVHEGLFEPGKIQFRLHDVNVIEKHGDDFFINNGSPHVIRFVGDVESCDVNTLGKEIRYSDQYSPEGTNVNFVQLETDHILVRTYERGVEDETLSCGTGVTASAIAASFHSLNSPIVIKTLGGMLSVSFRKLSDSHFSDICLTGPATKIFDGELNLDSF